MGNRKRTVKEILESRTVAVIGASHDTQKPGTVLLRLLNQTGFNGKVAGVNPRGGEVEGVPLYPSIQDVPFPVDMAVLLIPPHAVPSAVKDCARKGVKGVVISSEGFAETGDLGRQYQEEVRAVLESSGMRGFGPNTMGLLNTATGLTTAYFIDKGMIKEPGSVGFAAQSGIFAGALLRYMSSFRELRPSKVLGLGNKVDVNETDALDYLMNDRQTRIIGMYLEDVRNGREFLNTAKRAVQKKPVLLIKGGRSSAGAKASASHTASLAVDDLIMGGALRQAGVLRMGGIDELISTITGFRTMPLPKGDRIALITYSGAQAIMSIDAAVEAGLGLAGFSDKTKARLASVIATPSKAQNPIDFYPDMTAHGFEKTAKEILLGLLEDNGVHGIVFISFALLGAEPYRELVDIVRNQTAKPVFFSLLGELKDLEASRVFFEKNRIPLYLFPEMAVRVFAHMWRYAQCLGH